MSAGESAHKLGEQFPRQLGKEHVDRRMGMTKLTGDGDSTPVKGMTWRCDIPVSRREVREDPAPDRL